MYNYSTFAGKHQALFKVLDFDTSQEVATLESPNRNPAIPVTKLHSASDHVNPSRFNSWMTQGSIRAAIFVIIPRWWTKLDSNQNDSICWVKWSRNSLSNDWTNLFQRVSYFIRKCGNKGPSPNIGWVFRDTYHVTSPWFDQTNGPAMLLRLRLIARMRFVKIKTAGHSTAQNFTSSKIKHSWISQTFGVPVFFAKILGRTHVSVNWVANVFS